MKIISDHLGQIIAAIAAVAILITSVVYFKGPIGDFFGNIVEKETGIGDRIVANIEDVDLQYGESGGSGGGSSVAAEATGSYIFVNDVSPITHNLKINLTSDSITDFSDVTVKRTGKNILNLENLTSNGETENLIYNSESNSISFTKTSAAQTVSMFTAKQYLPAGTYTISGNYNKDVSLIKINKNGSNIANLRDGNPEETFTITEAGECEILYMAAYAAPENTVVEFSNMQLEFGNVSSEFEPFTEETTKAAADGSVNNIMSISPNMVIMTDTDNVQITCTYKKNITTSSLALPETVYGFVGQPIKMYFLNMIEQNSLDDLIIEADAGGKGTIFDDRWEYTPTKAGTIVLKVSVFDLERKLLASGSTKIEVKDSSKSNDLSLLVIGDSTIAFKDETEELLNLANSDNYNLTLLGSQFDASNSLNRHEGRGGWRADTYVSTSVNNPFYNPDTECFDFEYYMTTQNYTNVDCVSIQLGINDIFQAKTDKELKYKMITYFENMEFIINNIHEYDPDIKIIWNMIIPGSVDQSKFEAEYGTQQTADRHKINVYKTNMEIIRKYKNINNLYLAPINVSLDVENNMESGGTGAVHPSEAGYDEIATLLYSFIRAIN